MDNMGVKRLLTSKLRAAKSANQLFGVMLFHNVLTQGHLLLGCEGALGTFVFGDDFMCKVKMFLQLEFRGKLNIADLARPFLFFCHHFQIRLFHLSEKSTMLDLLVHLENL